KTKSFFFGDVVSPKVGYGGELEWNNSNGTVTVTPILDEVPQASFDVNVASGGFAVPFTPPFYIAPSLGISRSQFDLFKYGEYRELQLDMIGSGPNRKELRQMNAAAIIRPTQVGNS